MDVFHQNPAKGTTLLPCAHLLGLGVRKTIPVAKAARKTGATVPTPPKEGPVPPIRRVAESKPAFAKQATAAPARPAASAGSKPAFAHLLPAADLHNGNAIGVPPSVTTPSAKPVSGMAAKILTAAAKAKTPTGTGASPPTGLAAEILAAGRKLRAAGGV